jgi:hypothetical protein
LIEKVNGVTLEGVGARIRTHLSGAVRNRVIDPWDDSKIRPGSNWKNEIKRALASAKVAVILVSPNFLGPEFIAQHEFPPLMEAAQKEGLTICWILVSSCMYEDCGIQHYQAAHGIAKPLDQLKPANRNSVPTQICRKVRDAAAKPVRSFKEERFDKSPPERAYDSVLELWMTRKLAPTKIAFVRLSVIA